MERVVGGKYKLGRKIGSGSFGEIYLGECFRFIRFGLSFSLNRAFLLFFIANSIVSVATDVNTFEIVAAKIVSSVSLVFLLDSVGIVLDWFLFEYLFGALNLVFPRIMFLCVCVRSSSSS